MKVYLSMALAAIFMITTVSAQHVHVNLGVKGGLNLFNIKTDNGVNYDTKAGLHLGLLGHIHITKQFAIQPELVFSQQGAKFTTSGNETKINLNYINVPVLFQYMFDNGFRIEAGPQVGLLISAKSKTNSNDTDIKDDLKKTDIGLAAGIGYIFVPSGFGVDARYNFGLTDINDNGSVKLNNRGFQLGVFYQFNHK